VKRFRLTFGRSTRCSLARRGACQVCNRVLFSFLFEKLKKLWCFDTFLPVACFAAVGTGYASGPMRLTLGNLKCCCVQSCLL
jgi:hypothetical protein